MPVRFEVNGKQVAVEVEPRMTLVERALQSACA